MSSGILIAMVGIGGTLAGAGLQALTGFWTAKRAEKAEHFRWLRDERVRVYGDVVASLQRLLAFAESGADQERVERRCSPWHV